MADLNACVPGRGVAHLGRDEVERLVGPVTGRLAERLRDIAIDSERRVRVRLDRPVRFSAGGMVIELDSSVEAHLGETAVGAIRGLRIDGNTVERAERTVDRREGPGIRVHGRGLLGIQGSRFVPLE